MESTNIGNATSIIRYYNVCARSACGYKVEKNQRIALDALERAGGDITKVYDHIRKWVDENRGIANGDTYPRCLRSFVLLEEKPKEDDEKEPEITETEVQYSMTMLEKAVIQMISTAQAEKIES